MSEIGFICPELGNVTYAACFNCDHEMCGLPLPYRMAASNDRETEADTFHVTEILNPDKQVYLERHYDYYSDPHMKAFPTFGTAWHNMVEQYAKGNPRFSQEESFVALIGDFYLSGRCDLKDLLKLKLQDWKTTAVYKVKLSMAGDYFDWSMQQNIYRPFIFPEAQALEIVALARDWKKSQNAKECKPIEIINLPILDENETLAWAVERIETLSSYDNELSLPDCTPKQCWENWDRSEKKLVRRRCEDFCGAGGDSGICTQYSEWKDGLP